MNRSTVTHIVPRLPARISLLERFLAGWVLFYAAVVFCLPVAYSDEVASLYPWWGKRIGIGNVQLQELVFVAWIALFGARFVVRSLLNGGIPMRQATIWLIGLAMWCGLISMVAPLPWLDLGRTFRLLLNAALLFAVVRWTWQTDEFPLATLIFGFLCGTIINLILSFQYPMIVFETMRLSGQNTPGVAMGIAIHLTAWLFFRTKRPGLQLFAIVSTLVFSFGCAISYSRIGWFAGGLGLLAWIYVLIVVRPREVAVRRRLRKLRLVLVPVLVLGLASFLTSPLGREGIQWIQLLAQQKVSNQGESDTIRWAYVSGTTEIIARYPFGVGYSGFFDAMMATDTYASGRAAEEESWESANPHAAFLWYTTAGGIPGGLMALLLFVMLLNSMRVGLVAALGRPGFILFALVVLPFLVIGMTVTYLFNSIILIVPAAIAAGWGWAHRTRWVEPLHTQAASPRLPR